MSEAEILTGGCLCGTVRYRVSGPWQRFVHCHCSRCRRATGTGHATNLLAAPDALRWLSGEERVARYDLPTAASFATCFCQRCGAPLPHRTRGGSAWVIPAGSLDAGPDAAPSDRIFFESRVPWSCGDEVRRRSEPQDGAAAGVRAIGKVVLTEKLGRFTERWSPRIVGELNGQHVKLAKLEGEFVWHHHEHEDELFLVLHGHLSLHLRDRVVELDPGEFCIVPRGVEHRPVAKEETHVMLFEPASTRNTGQLRNERTVDAPERL